MTAVSDNNKRIAKNTMLLYFRMMLTMVVSLYTSRVVLNTLGVEDYGIYNVVGGFVAMFSIFSGAMTTAVQRFISFEIGKGNKGDVRSLFSTVIIIHLILAIIIALFAESIGVWFLNNKMNFSPDRYYAANWVFQLSLLTFLVNVISVPYNAAIVAYEKMSAFAYISIIEVSLKLIAVFLLVISPIDKLIMYAIFLAIIAITIRVIYGIYCNRKFKNCRCNWKWNKQCGKEVFSFVSWNLIGSFAGIAKEQGVNVCINVFFGATLNAARGIAVRVMSVLTSFVSNFQMAMNPQIVKLYAAGNKDEMFKLVFRGSKFSFMLLIILTIPVILEAPMILKLWLKNVPDFTVLFLRLSLIVALIDCLSNTLIASMHASGKVKEYQIVVGGISLLTLPMVYLVFKLGYPPYSAFVIAIIMAFILHIVRLVMLKKSIGLPIMKFLKQVTLKVFFLFTMSIIIPLFLYQILETNISSFFIICIVSCLSSSLVCYVFGLSKNEKKIVIEKIASKLKKNNEYIKYS